MGSTRDVRETQHMSFVAANLPRGVLPDENVAALKTLAEALADGQHTNTTDEDSDGANSDDGDSDGDFPWEFPEEAEDPEEAASRKRARAECERDEAIMNKHDVEDAVIDAQEELLNDDEVCCKCESAGHNDSLLLCDGGLNLRHFTRTGQGFKKRKPEQKCAVACHTFCCELRPQLVDCGRSSLLCEYCGAPRSRPQAALHDATTRSSLRQGSPSFCGATAHARPGAQVASRLSHLSERSAFLPTTGRRCRKGSGSARRARR